MAAGVQTLFSIVNCMWTHLWHNAGNFPVRLAPDQVRVDADFSATPFKYKRKTKDEIPAEHLPRCLRRSSCEGQVNR